jgi:hypothetical protein
MSDTFPVPYFPVFGDTPASLANDSAIIGDAIGAAVARTITDAYAEHIVTNLKPKRYTDADGTTQPAASPERD